MNQIVKIFFFLLMATMLASITVYGSSSDVSMQKRIEFNSRKSINSEKIRVNAKSIENKTQMRVITNQPEGESKRYNVTGEGVILDGAHLTTGAFSGRADIVYGADNKVYIKNIIAGLGNYFGDSWVEGTIEGNEIHVPMGQSIYWSNDYQADVVLCMGTTRIVDNTITFQADDQATEAIFVIDGSTITLQGGYADPVSVEYPEYEGYGLGTFWTDDASFGGFIEWNTTLEEVIKVTTYTVAGLPYRYLERSGIQRIPKMTWLILEMATTNSRRMVTISLRVLKYSLGLSVTTVGTFVGLWNKWLFLFLKTDDMTLLFTTTLRIGLFNTRYGVNFLRRQYRWIIPLPR